MRALPILICRSRLFVAALLLALVQPALAVDMSKQCSFDIKPQKLATALLQFSHQCGLQVVVGPEVKNQTTDGVSGKQSIANGLSRLLKSSGLTYTMVGDSSIAVGRPAAEKSNANANAEAAVAGAEMRLALLEEGGGRAKSPGGDVESMIVEGEREKPAPFSTANLDLTRTEDDILPFQTFTARDIELSGAANVEEFLRKRLPQFVTEYFPEENNTTGFNPSAAPGSAGYGTGSENSLNLRGWGLDKGNAARETVILVNGRTLPPRFAPTGTDSSMMQGDFRGIPLGLIERIEILSSAGSAIYGGGATSGVVNIILREDARGGQVAVNYENTWHGRSPRRSMDVSYGLPLRWGIGLQISGGMSDSQPLHVEDRLDITQLDLQLRENYNRTVLDDWGAPREEIISYGYKPDYIVPAPFVGATTNIQSIYGAYDDPAAANLFASLGNPGMDYNVTSVPDGYTGGQGIAPFVARAGLYNFNLSEGAQDTSYSRKSTMGDPMRSRNFGLSLERALGRRFKLAVDYSYSRSENTPGSNYFNPAAGAGFGSVFSVPGTAAINPFGQDVIVAFDDPRMRRPEVKQGSISISQTVSSTLHANLGEWRGVLDASWSKYKGVWNNSYFFAPLNGWRDAFLTGAYNPFVDMRVAAPADPEFYETYVLAKTSGESASTYRQAAAKISGPGYRLPAGSVQLTAGLGWSRQARLPGTQENRHVHSRTGEVVPYANPPLNPVLNRIDRPDAFVTARTLLYTFDSRSAYAEAVVPVMSAAQHIPLVSHLDIFTSARIESAPRKGLKFVDGSFVPFTYDARPHTTAFGARYDAIEGMSIRASRSIGFRPPTMEEATPAAPPTEFRISSILNYGRGYGEPLIDPRRNNQNLSAAGMQMLDGGNPDILPETTVSTNYGLILQPRTFKGLRFSVDYVENVRNNAISFFSPVQQLLDLEEEYPDRIGRGTPDGLGVGPINFLDIRTVNFRQISSKSIDLGLTHEFSQMFGGQLVATVAASKMLSFKLQRLSGSPPVEQVGRPTAQYAYSRLPSWSGNAQLQWQRSSWVVGWSANYLDSIQYGDASTMTWTTTKWALDHDAFVSYRTPVNSNPHGAHWLFTDTSITFGMKNVFDREPRLLGGIPGNRTLTDSIIGRSVWLQVRKGFN